MKKLLCFGILLCCTLICSLGVKAQEFKPDMPKQQIHVVGGAVQLNFDSGKGSKCKSIKVGVGVAPSTKYKLPIPKRKGYTFVGWFTKNGYKVNETQQSLSHAFKTMYAGETGTVYAKWIKNTSITVVKRFSSGKSKVSWKSVKDATVYEVQYATKRNFNDVTGVLIPAGKSTSIKLPTQKEQSKYYVRVRTQIKIGKKVYTSKWSRVKIIKQ